MSTDHKEEAEAIRSRNVKAACERLALELRLQREDTLIPDAGQAQFMLDIHLVITALAARNEDAEAFRALKAILEGPYRRVHLEKEIQFDNAYWAWTDDEYKELADTLPKAIFALKEGELNR